MYDKSIHTVIGAFGYSGKYIASGLLLGRNYASELARRRISPK
jgi:short subunit dehydrogenase-like uncharacterized protein